MLGHAQGPHPPDEVAPVVAAVRAHGRRSADAALQHLKRRCPLGPPVGLGQLDIDDQTVPVLGQHLTEVAELRALLLALAVEPRLWIGGRDVRLAAAALTLEVPHHGCARRRAVAARRADGSSCARTRRSAACR